MTSGGLSEQIELMESGWRKFREAASGLRKGVETTRPAGWTVKELVAHVARREDHRMPPLFVAQPHASARPTCPPPFHSAPSELQWTPAMAFPS